LRLFERPAKHIELGAVIHTAAIDRLIRCWLLGQLLIAAIDLLGGNKLPGGTGLALQQHVYLQ
jgi:hypothetical protein